MKTRTKQNYNKVVQWSGQPILKRDVIIHSAIENGTDKSDGARSGE